MYEEPALVRGDHYAVGGVGMSSVEERRDSRECT